MILPIITATEESSYQKIIAEAKAESKSEGFLRKEAYCKDRIPEWAAKYNISEQEAENIIRSRIGRNLALKDYIEFQEFGQVSVKEVLSNPKKYNNQSCADPLEPEEGRGRAIFYANVDTGKPLVNSKLHGGQLFFLPTNNPEKTSSPNKLRSMILGDFLDQDIPETKMLLNPIIAEQSILEIHAYRGVGKTHTSIGIAVAVASGGTLF